MMDEGDVFEMSASAVHSPAAGTRAAAAVASIDRPNGALEADHVERTVRVRLLTVSVLAAILVSLLLAVPGLRSVAHEIGHVDGGWLILAGALELASCASFVVIFRRFFAGVPARQARRLAWTEMGSGALLPGGGVGSLAVGGWLLHMAGMPTRKIVRSSSGLFFLTSAVNVAALIGAALLLAFGLSAGQHDPLRVGLPILLGTLAAVAVLSVARASRRRSSGLLGSRWVTQLVDGIGEVRRVLGHPGWRLGGALGYLGFDIAVLWATLTAVGYSPPISVLVLGYIIGYLANLIPVPGAIGVLEGGIAGTLVLYGAPLTQATAGVLMLSRDRLLDPGPWRADRLPRAASRPAHDGTRRRTGSDPSHAAVPRRSEPSPTLRPERRTSEQAHSPAPAPSRAPAPAQRARAAQRAPSGRPASAPAASSAHAWRDALSPRRSTRCRLAAIAAWRGARNPLRATLTSDAARRAGRAPASRGHAAGVAGRAIRAIASEARSSAAASNRKGVAFGTSWIGSSSESEPQPALSA